MNSRLIIPTVAIALSVALPAFAASEITGTLTGGAGATSSSGSLSGTVATSSGGSLSGTVVAPPTTSTGGGGGGGGGGGAGSIGIFPTTTSTTTTTPGSVLGTSTPGLPNTGAGGNWLETMLALIASAAIGISGIAYLKYRTR